MVWRFFALIFLLGCQFRGCQFLAKDPILRVVTWNVGDNAKMQKKPTDPGFTDEAIDRLLLTCLIIVRSPIYSPSVFKRNAGNAIRLT